MLKKIKRPVLKSLCEQDRNNLRKRIAERYKFNVCVDIGKTFDEEMVVEHLKTVKLHTFVFLTSPNELSYVVPLIFLNS